MNVVLVHGWGNFHPERFYSKMKSELEKAGYCVHIPKYNFWKSIQENSEVLKNFLKERRINSCNFVGNSMGNIIIRYFISENSFNCERFVAICPPFNKPKLLNLLRPRWLAKRVVGEGLIQIASDKSIHKNLPNTELGIITGNRRLSRTPIFFLYTLFVQLFLWKNNDGLMTENEALPTDLKYEHITVNHNHEDYPNGEVISQIISFLENGKFLK